MKTRMTLSIAALTMVACAEPPSGPIGLEEARIEDGAHNAGNPHFFFLPPMVPAPVVSGAFDPGLSPIVDICALSGSTCTGPPIAQFTTAIGPGSETVRVSSEDESYRVNWHTNEFNLDPAVTYRIAVHVDDVLLGYADVDVVASGKELKNVNTGEYIPLKDGRTLPIAFRIENGALPVVLLGQVIDFDQHSEDSLGSLLFFTDAGAIYEVEPNALGSGAELRTTNVPLGVVAVTSNRLDNSFVAVTASGQLFSFYEADGWAFAVAQGSVPVSAPVIDIAQQSGAGTYRMIVGTADGEVFEVDPSFTTPPVQRAVAAYSGAVALTSNDKHNSFVMVTANGDIFESFIPSDWGTWQFRFDLPITGVVDFHQIGANNSDFPVIRADGGPICWWDPRNHHTCDTSNLPGGLVASGFIQAGRLKLASTADGMLYTAHSATVVDWTFAGSLVP